MAFRKLVKKMEANGWRCVRVNGSHYIYTHEEVDRPVPIQHHSKDIPKKLVKKIEAETGLRLLA